MAWKDLFKSKQERERELERKRRRAFRKAERPLDSVKDRIRKLKLDRDKAWSEAADYLRDGQKSAAQRSLQSVRASEVVISKLERKRWVFEQRLVKLESAKTDQEITGALAELSAVVNIDPEAVAEVLGEVDDKLDEQADVEKIWEKAYEKDMEGAAVAMADQVPSLDQMMADLMDEVTADRESEAASRSREGTAKKTGQSDDTAALRARARKIIDGNVS